MKKTLLSLSIAIAGTAMATPFTGNDAPSNAMGNTGVASARPQGAFQFNPGLLADYSDAKDFGLTLPSIKFFVDDSLGLLKAGEDFFTGGTLDDFQNIDVAAFNVAVNGDGGSTQSLTDIFTAIGTNITTIAGKISDIQTDAGDGTVDTPANITDLQTASASLTTNTNSLNSQINVTKTQALNLSTAVTGAVDGIESLNDKPLQLGLGIDILNVALPSSKLGMALSISTNSLVGANLSLSSADASLLTGASNDLVSLTTNATNTTTQMTQLAAANQDVTDHVATVPDRSDYAVGAPGDLAYANDVQTWANTLDTLFGVVQAGTNGESNGDSCPPGNTGDL